jgi:hypothetical protein
MKDFDLKKECETEEFDYASAWGEDEDKNSEKKIKELPKGVPRTGLKGKYLKKKNHVGRMQLRQSWSKGKINDEV